MGAVRVNPLSLQWYRTDGVLQEIRLLRKKIIVGLQRLLKYKKTYRNKVF
jgi:hypothetical protein